MRVEKLSIGKLEVLEGFFSSSITNFLCLSVLDAFRGLQLLHFED